MITIVEIEKALVKKVQLVIDPKFEFKKDIEQAREQKHPLIHVSDTIIRALEILSYDDLSQYDFFILNVLEQRSKGHESVSATNKINLPEFSTDPHYIFAGFSILFISKVYILNYHIFDLYASSPLNPNVSGPFRDFTSQQYFTKNVSSLSVSSVFEKEEMVSISFKTGDGVSVLMENKKNAIELKKKLFEMIIKII